MATKKKPAGKSRVYITDEKIGPTKAEDRETLRKMRDADKASGRTATKKT